MAIPMYVGEFCEALRICVYACMHAQVDAGEHHHLADRLRRVRVTSINELHISPAQNTFAHDEPRVLRALLVVLRALSCTGRALVLCGWRATQQLVAELRCLPSWEQLGLCFKQPADIPTPTHRLAGALAQVLGLIPRSFTYVYMDRGSMKDERDCEALVLQAPANRTAEQPLCLAVGGQREKWVTYMQEMLLHADTYPHVTIEGGTKPWPCYH